MRVGSRQGVMFRRSLFLLLLVLALGCDRGAESDLPISGTIGEFSLRDQSGKAFGNADLRGKVWVAAFMFTRCPTVCPRMMGVMKKLQAQAKAKSLPLHLVSFSVDPENDSPEVLQAFAKKYEVDQATWSFLTGDYEAVKRTSVEGFKMALEGKADPDAEDFGILHGSHLVLVDKQLRIRGFYSTKTDAELEKLLQDAEGLTR